MATTLRCRAAGMDISSHYNAFVEARRAQLELANAAIRTRFANDGGQTAYDGFATALANAYGDGATTPASCDEAAATADDAAGSPAMLFELAEQRITPPTAEAGRCAAREALASATPAPTPVRLAPAGLPVMQVADAPIVPPPADGDDTATLTLASATVPDAGAPSPAEVAAAIAVLTRYQALQSKMVATAAP